jgi:Family of unknown function (DUF5695)
VIQNPQCGANGVPAQVVRVQPQDAFRQRVYVAPRGLWLTLDSGTFESIEINTRTHAVRAGLSASTPSVSRARLRIEQPSKAVGADIYRLKENLPKERDAFVVTLQNKTSWIELIDGRP